MSINSLPELVKSSPIAIACGIPWKLPTALSASISQKVIHNWLMLYISFAVEMILCLLYLIKCRMACISFVDFDSLTMVPA